MRGWSIKNCPTACSFGVKLLLLAGTVGFLSLAGLLQNPFQSIQAEALPMRQAGVETSLGRLPERQSVTVADVAHVDINHDSTEDLQRVPGIGPVLAERVIRYRQENGNFSSIRDIQNVKGIGVKRFARFEPYIRIDRKHSSPDE